MMTKQFKSHINFRISLFLFIIFVVSFAAVAQNDDLTAKSEMIRRYLSAIEQDDDDGRRLQYSDSIRLVFSEILKTEASFDYDFKLSDKMAVLKSDDHLLRVYNWNVPMNDGSNKYFGFLQYKSKKRGRSKFSQLIDIRNMEETPENRNLFRVNWHGVLYYKLIYKKARGERHYALLGWNGKDKLTHQKSVDILTFTPQGEPRFGEPVINANGKMLGRVELSYSSRSVMHMQYHEDKDAIIFDHLAPIKPYLADNYSFYAPDGSNDAFKYENGEWNFIKAVQIGNAKKKRKTDKSSVGTNNVR